MAYVGFKRGLQANLPTTQDAMNDGYFYLTSDTNRLYVCKTVGSTKQLVELNQSITSVSSMGNLPTGTSSQATGQFYYVSNDNVLCVYDGTRWVQINPDTRLFADNDNTTVTSTTGGVTVSNLVKEDRSSGARESSGSFSIVGGGVISVSETADNVITVSADAAIDTQYDLTSGSTSTGASIALTNKQNANDSDVINIVGTQNVTVSNNNSTITVQGPALLATTDASFDAQGNLNIEASVDGMTSTGDSVTPILAYGKTADATPVQYGTTAKFISGTANLDVYTTGQVDALVDSKLQAADAMTYKGAAANATAITGITAANNKKGDTYKASADFTLNGEAVKSGDLIIYNGADGTNTASNWDIIPSGNDQLISTEATAASNKLEVLDNTIGIGSVQLVAGDKMIISSTVATGTNNLVTTIGQDNNYAIQSASGTASNVALSAATATSTSQTFTAVTGITTDAYGNVAPNSLKTATLTVVDSHANIDDVTINTSASNNTATIQTIVSDTDNQDADASFTITSGNFTVTAGTGQVNISLEWGSF